MTARTPEEAIRELAQGLAPVRPIPPLRSALAAAIALGLVALAAQWLLGGPGLRAGGAVASSLPYLATLAGLAFVALAAIGAALAAAVPGREVSTGLGARVAALGLVLAIAGGLWGIAHGDVPAAEEDLRACLLCIGRALCVGTIPGSGWASYPNRVGSSRFRHRAAAPAGDQGRGVAQRAV